MILLVNGEPLGVNGLSKIDNIVKKNIISRYCHNFALTPSYSAWKMRVNIPRMKLVKTVWIFRKKIEKSSPRCSRPPYNLKFDNFTLLSRREPNTRAGHAKLLFLLIKPIDMWHSHSLCHCPYLRSILMKNKQTQNLCSIHSWERNQYLLLVRARCYPHVGTGTS